MCKAYFIDLIVVLIYIKINKVQWNELNENYKQKTWRNFEVREVNN